VATVLHVAPHPDDEALGAPATLLLLRRAGWQVVNVVTTLGRPEDRERRREEALDAARRAGFDLVLPDGRPVAHLIASLVRDHVPELVISPSAHDVHPTHVAVGEATGRALASCPTPPVWWQWGLWADLAAPTLYVPFGEEVLAAARHVLEAYTGELARNDYTRLLDARSVVQAVLGSERVFGFGRAAASTAPFAELLTEQCLVDGAWCPGTSRILDPDHALG
jgi:LmbE family N-acetylglucosaminyl deacetylase